MWHEHFKIYVKLILIHRMQPLAKGRGWKNMALGVDFKSWGGLLSRWGGGEFSEGQVVRTKFLEGARFSRTNLCCFRFSYISIYLIENGAMYKNIYIIIPLTGLCFDIASLGLVSLEQFLLTFFHSTFFFLKKWNSLHARLNSHYKAWSYKKHKKITAYRKSV